MLIAGTLNGEKAPPPPPDSWAAKEETNTCILLLKMEAGAKWNLTKTDSETDRSLYFYRGNNIMVNKTEVPAHQAIHLEAGSPLEVENGQEVSYLLLLQSRPIKETVVQYGPFVMNSKTDIQQAFDDYRATSFGGWPWDRSDQVHKRELGRFAKYADGKEDKP
jgi:redox-sensitive bicupin YhaK (pirin superfamily)